jgi:hypothetical protein
VGNFCEEYKHLNDYRTDLIDDDNEYYNEELEDLVLEANEEKVNNYI